MSNPITPKAWRSYGIAPWVVAAASAALIAPASAAPKSLPPRAARVTYLSGCPASILPDKAMLFTAWVTPLGKRYDMPGGKTLIEPRASATAYEIDPQAKTATLEQADAEDALLDARQDVFEGHAVAGKIIVSHQSLLGYPCLVRKGNLDVAGCGPTPVETWVATVAGRRVTLRTKIGSGNTLLVTEAISVQTYPQAPAGLLDVPKGYTVVAQK